MTDAVTVFGYWPMLVTQKHNVICICEHLKAKTEIWSCCELITLTKGKQKKSWIGADHCTGLFSSLLRIVICAVI